MKKILFAAAAFVAASLSSFGASCTNFNGSSVNFYANTVGTCQIGNGATLWNISNFTVFNNVSNGINIADMTDTQLLVSFTELGNNGFSVTYTTPGNALFNYQPTPSPAQANLWSNGMWITGLKGASLTDDVVSIGAAYAGETGNVNFSFRKIVQNQQGGLINSGLIVSYGTALPTNNQFINSASFGSSLSVNDRIVFDSGGTNGGAITSYTNIFYGGSDPTGVPEPMSFVLMGAGLVGVAALRRRNS